MISNALGVPQMLILNKGNHLVTGNQHLVSVNCPQEGQDTPEYKVNAGRVSFDTAPLPLADEVPNPF